MMRTPAQKISDALICLSILALIAEAFLLPWINAFAYFQANMAGGPTLEHLMAVFAYDFDDGLGNLLRLSLESWDHAHSAVLALFLWLVALRRRHFDPGHRILARCRGRPSPEKRLLRRAGQAALPSLPEPGRTGLPLPGGFRRSGLYTPGWSPVLHGGAPLPVLVALFSPGRGMKAENDLTFCGSLWRS
jgi:hypothetical protein